MEGITVERTGSGISRAWEFLVNYRWVILFVCWMAHSVSYMPRLGLGPLAPFMKADLALTKAQFGLFASCASAGFVTIFVPAGWVTDKWGVRIVLFFGQVIGGIALISMFFTHTYFWGLFIMFLGGMSLGAITPATGTGVVLWFRAKERATAMGLKQTSLNCGGMLTALTLPVIAIAYGWRIGFVLLGIAAIISGIASLVLYRNPSQDEAQAAAPAVPPGTPKTRGDSGVICEAVAPASRKESSLTIFKSRDIWFVTIAAMALGANEFSIFTYYVLYLKEHMLIPVVSAGFLLGAVDLGGLFGKPITGIMSDRLFGGRRKEVFILLAAIATILTVVIALLPVGIPQWVLLVCSAVFGFGAVAWAGIFYTIVGEFGGKEHCGIVTGFAIGMVAISATVGVPVFGHLADMTHAWTWSWVYATATGAIGTFMLFFVREERKRLQE